MSKFLDKFRYFKHQVQPFSNGYGEASDNNRDWEDSYRQRWQHDKVVRSTHGVNCTGSCSWKIYVKNGLVTWEMQQTDYPDTRPDLPNHEPRGCPRGASYSWYLYSANRVKYPLIRKQLMQLWQQAKQEHHDPVLAWASIVNDAEKAHSYKSVRGHGGFIRATWEEMNELIAAANIFTIKQYGPDRVAGFSPIPAMSMVSYAAGTRYLSLLGGVCLSFYDWYCDLPPASPMTWGEQTDVPESADWYNSNYIIVWGSNVPQTRTPDAHFLTEARYKGTKTVAITSDFSEIARLCDVWLHPIQGSDSALAMAMGHIILKEFYLQNPSEYFTNYARRYTDMPMLVMLDKHANGHYVAGRQLRAADLLGCADQQNNPEWKTIALDRQTQRLVVPHGSIGFRWGEKGKWNLENNVDGQKEAVDLGLTVMEGDFEVIDVDFPYFGNQTPGGFKHDVSLENIIPHKVPVRKIVLADGQSQWVATVFDLLLANYGVDRHLGDDQCTDDDQQVKAYTPKWAEQVTGLRSEHILTLAREFATNANKTHGRSMIIVGAGVNHWFHTDMTYRGLINILVFCGCIGQSGGGWAHYVGQEKLRPQTGWLPLAFALDWQRPPRHMNSTSFYYNHSDQWRYEALSVHSLLSPLADKSQFSPSIIDYNVKAERLGWLPSAPQLNVNPLHIAKTAQAQGISSSDYVVNALKTGKIRFAAEQPDDPQNFPRNFFVWRSNLFASSSKGNEYMLKHLLGTTHGLQGKDLGEQGEILPQEIEWVEKGAEGKIDLLTTLDFRMSSTCLYSDIVLPTATWYEKYDMSTSDMHPFIHPFSAAVDPAWGAKPDWDIYKGIAKMFSQLCPDHLGVEKDLVTLPILHDSPGELGQAFDAQDWKAQQCELVPGKTAPNFIEVERDYPNVYQRFTALGPLMEKLGNGSKGLNWDITAEVDLLRQLNGTHSDEYRLGRPKIETAIDAAETILTLAPETNGQVAMKAWQSLGQVTGRDHSHLASGKAHVKIRFNDLQHQPRKIISSPTWSGLEDDHVSYNAGYTNVHELIPWRTLSGRQQLYQDHSWMRAFGEQLVCYRPPIDTRSTELMPYFEPNGFKTKKLNFLTPHQKWGIHSTYSDNLLMLTLGRGGPVAWLSEQDAEELGIQDNDWIEAFNVHGAFVARAIISQRIPPGMVMMYHAQECLVNLPGSEITRKRSGVHNSVTKICPKPTHMIGAYAQLAYGLNYYGPIGANRDDFVLLRKMHKIDWLDESKPTHQTNQQ